MVNWNYYRYGRNSVIKNQGTSPTGKSLNEAEFTYIVATELYEYASTPEEYMEKVFRGVEDIIDGDLAYKIYGVTDLVYFLDTFCSQFIVGWIHLVDWITNFGATHAMETYLEYSATFKIYS